MSQKERVGISEFRVAEAPAVLVSYGLGSCLGIALYDQERRRGGLAHTLLPAPRPGVGETRLSKFVDSAIRLMVEELVRRGAGRERLVAKIIGGANMFAPPNATPEDGIGTRNVRAARHTLEALQIPLRGEDVGGNHGRTVEFDLATGIVFVRSVRGSDRISRL